jgi:hypothetical protein
MKLTKLQLKKMFKEEYDRMKEQEYPELGSQGETDFSAVDPDVALVNNLEDSLGKLLGDLYGNQSSIPIEVLEAMEALMQSINIGR